MNHYTKPWVASKKVSRFLLGSFWESKSLPSFREMYFLLQAEQLKIKRGVETLKKYMYFFPDSLFTLITENGDNDIVWFALINKKKLVDMVKLHLDDFKTPLQELGINPEQLAENEICLHFIKKLKSEYLIGILLGFGQKNASLYDRYCTNFSADWPLISMWHDEDEEHLRRIHEKEFSCLSWDLTDLFYPYFACDPHSEETKLLKNIYREEREKIIHYFEGKEVVEATLSLFNLFRFTATFCGEDR